ncbi:hypothetical protein KY290_001188 [Solanum tuberosum]|uniref:Retrotransposon Copia-like N-terminal domain-containing protein n=2 Tax=Solanum tuberosum TaxID=4113 RepID=A0ABQ7WNQ3_SOLTU|nr:hypothetical protein KY289_001304 [Solanum tuberosum]KAH0781590.1 hypothetical protein KY290_001188 [Solanum tuberosum]
MVDENISPSSSLQGTTVGAQTSTVTTLPSPSLAHQLPLKLRSSNFLLWKTRFLPMVRGCGLGHHIDSSQVIPGKFLSGVQPNPDYHVWVGTNQLALLQKGPLAEIKYGFSGNSICCDTLYHPSRQCWGQQRLLRPLWEMLVKGSMNCHYKALAFTAIDCGNYVGR